MSVGGSVATPHDVRLELDSIAVLRLDSRGQVVDTVRVMADRERLRIVQDWLVFAEDGRLRGLVHTPPMFRLFTVVDDHVFGVVSDELDVQYVRAFPLLPPLPGTRG